MKRFLLVLAMVLFVLAGCGDDSDSDNGGDSGGGDEQEESADEVAFDDWVDEVNDICADLDADLDDVDEPSAVDDFETIIEAGEETQELGEAAFTDIEDVGLPDEETATATVWLDSWEDRFAAIEDLIAAAEDEDEDAVEEALDDGEAANEDGDEISEELGLDDCVGEDSEDSEDEGEEDEDEPTDDGSEDPESTFTTPSGGAAGEMDATSDVAVLEAELAVDFETVTGFAAEEVSCSVDDLEFVTSFECEVVDEDFDVWTLELNASPTGGFDWTATAINGVGI